MTKKIISGVGTFIVYILFSFAALAGNSDVISTIKNNALGDTALEQAVGRLLTQSPAVRAEFMAQILNRVQSLSKKGYVDAEIVETVELLGLAMSRSNILLTFLNLDIDGDLTLSTDEFAILKRHYSNRKDMGTPNLATVEYVLTEFDFNDDGQVTLEEATRYAADIAESRSRKISAYSPQWYLLFDLDGDGKTTVEEVVKASAILSQSNIESADVGNSVVCNVPKPSPDGTFIAMRAFRGYALSNVALTGIDNVTTVSDVEIEAGSKPVYIIVGNIGSMILNINGATDRLEAVVMQGGGGVAGIEKSKVHLIGREECFRARLSDESDRIIASAQLNSFFGKIPDLLVDFSGAMVIDSDGSVAIERKNARRAKKIFNELIEARRKELEDQSASGESDTTSGQNEARYKEGLYRLERKMLGFYPGGVIEFQTSEITSALHVEYYSILPSEAGLLQLVRVNAISIFDRRNFLIAQPIERFPAGLSGGHSVRFIMATGVPMPAGKPGHSPGYSEETGECLTKNSC